MGEEKCCSGFGERVCQFVFEKSSVTHWKLKSYTGGDGVREVPYIPELWLEKRRSLGKKGKGR